MTEAAPDSLARLDRLAQELADTFGRSSPRSADIISAAWRRLLRSLLTEAPLAPDGRRQLSDEALEHLRTTIEARFLSLQERADTMVAVNRLLHWFARAGELNSGYLRIPHRLPRRLLTDFAAHPLGTLEYLVAIENRLHSPRPPAPPPGWRWEPAIWRYLVFLASLLLSSGIAVPRLHRRLLFLRPRDLSVPGWLTIPDLGPSPPNAPQLRCPLAATTTRHLRALTQELRHGRRGRSRADELLLPDAWRAHEGVARVLKRAWRAVLAHFRPDVAVPPHVDHLQCLPRLALGAALLRDLPPVVLAARAGRLDVRPMTMASFERCLGLPPRILHAVEPPPPRRGRRGRPGRAVEAGLFDLVERIRLSLARDARPRDCRDKARTLARYLHGLQRYRHHPRPTQGDDRAASVTTWRYNTWCYARWVQDLLEQAARGRIKAGTVNTRASAVAAAFSDVFVDRPFAEWEGSDWAAAIQELREEHQTDGAAIAVRQFRDLLVREGLAPEDPLPPQPRRRRRPQRPHALIDFETFKRGCAALRTRPIPRRLRRLLRIKLALGFWAGLRSREATRLRIEDVDVTSEVYLHVRDTKRRPGERRSERYLPLARLLPPRELTRLLAFRARRLAEAGDDPTAPLLSTVEHGRFYDSSYLASLAGLALRRAAGEPVCFHDLRHAFASWFPIRCAVAARVIDLPANRYPFARAPVFEPTSLNDLRKLLFGFGPARPGQDLFSHTLAVLAQLLGHSSPATTLTAYCHTVELLAHLFLHHPGPGLKRGQHPRLPPLSTGA